MIERRQELYRERQWELYRRSVVQGMPDSHYRTAVLAGIAHELGKLDSIETFPLNVPFSQDRIVRAGFPVIILTGPQATSLISCGQDSVTGTFTGTPVQLGDDRRATPD